MNVQLRDRPEAASTTEIKTAIADCDIHPARATGTSCIPGWRSAGIPISRPMACIPIRA